MVSGKSFVSKKYKNKNSEENLTKTHTLWIRDPESRKNLFRIRIQ
jgi:hypothetical protein